MASFSWLPDASDMNVKDLMTRIYHCVLCVTAYLACASDVKKQTKKGPRNQFKSGANTSPLLLSEAEVTQGGREEKQTQE